MRGKKMSKILIVYYSLTGTTRYVAETLRESISAEMLELKPKKDLNPKGGMKFVWGGAQANMKIKPKLLPFDTNPLDYDLVIIGTPVWSWTFTPPIRSFVSKFDLSDRKVALWTCSEGSGDKAMSRFKKAMSESELVSTIQFQIYGEERKNLDDIQERIHSWGLELLEKVNQN